MSNTIPAGRIQLVELAPKPFAAVLRMSQSIKLPGTLHDLVALRASQINGCAFCLDMHWKDLRAAGESEDRLYSLDAWRESPLYDEREQAALALTEAVTRITDGHVPDEVWEQAAAVFDPEELANLVFAIAEINVWNRMNITARVEPGHYDPSQRAELGATA